MNDVIRGTVTKNVLSALMEPSVIEYPFDLAGYAKQSREPLSNLLIRKNTLYKMIYKRIFGEGNNSIYCLITSSEPVLAYDDKLGWNLSITPNSILNNILKLLGSNTRIDDYYLYKNHKTVTYDLKKEYVIKVFEDIKNNTNIQNTKDLVDKVIQNIDYILNYYHKDLDCDNDLIVKSFVYFMAIDNLNRVEQGESVLSDLPITYHDRVSAFGISDWPYTVRVGNEFYYTYKPFNDRIEKLAKKDMSIFDKDKNRTYYSVLDDVELLPSGHIDRSNLEVKTKKGKVKFNENVFKLLKENENRIAFYESFGNKCAFIGKRGGLNGYFGYVFPNNYIVLDKFFTNYQTRYPAKFQAIYVLPSDKFHYSKLTKPEIMEIIKTDPSMDRFLHTGDWKSRIEEVYKRKDISSVDFETVANNYIDDTGLKLSLRG